MCLSHHPFLLGKITPGRKNGHTPLGAFQGQGCILHGKIPSNYKEMIIIKKIFMTSTHRLLQDLQNVTAFEIRTQGISLLKTWLLPGAHQVTEGRKQAWHFFLHFVPVSFITEISHCPQPQFIPESWKSKIPGTEHLLDQRIIHGAQVMQLTFPREYLILESKK